jgi:limonene-1,2-epoxide hydrolase
MTRTPDEVVTEFCGLWAKPDVDQIIGYFTEDAVYHNIPMAPAEGREAIRVLIDTVILQGIDAIDFQIHRQLSNGSGESAVVMNERTDVMQRSGGGRIELPVMGLFEVRDGRIALWRDYFDMATVTAGFA